MARLTTRPPRSPRDGDPRIRVLSPEEAVAKMTAVCEKAMRAPDYAARQREKYRTIETSDGRLVDFRTVFPLMDRDLYLAAKDLSLDFNHYGAKEMYRKLATSLPRLPDNSAKGAGHWRLCSIWRYYAMLHRERYGHAFWPDCSPVRPLP